MTCLDHSQFLTSPKQLFGVPLPWRGRACQSWKWTSPRSCRDVPSVPRSRSCAERSTARGRWQRRQTRQSWSQDRDLPWCDGTGTLPAKHTHTHTDNIQNMESILEYWTPLPIIYMSRCNSTCDSSHQSTEWSCVGKLIANNNYSSLKTTKICQNSLSLIIMTKLHCEHLTPVFCQF